MRRGRAFHKSANINDWWGRVEFEPPSSGSQRRPRHKSKCRFWCRLRDLSTVYPALELGRSSTELGRLKICLQKIEFPQARNLLLGRYGPRSAAVREKPRQAPLQGRKSIDIPDHAKIKVLARPPTSNVPRRRLLHPNEIPLKCLCPYRQRMVLSSPFGSRPLKLHDTGPRTVAPGNRAFGPTCFHLALANRSPKWVPIQQARLFSILDVVQEAFRLRRTPANNMVRSERAVEPCGGSWHPHRTRLGMYQHLTR